MTGYPMMLSGVLSLSLLLAGCGDSSTSQQAGNTSSDTPSDSNSNSNTSGGTTDNSSGTLSVPEGGRLLASQCFQCHGTNGKSMTGIDSLLGESQAEIVEEMLEMQTESAHDLMHFQARGYSTAQINAIAAYFASLSGAHP